MNAQSVLRGTYACSRETSRLLWSLYDAHLAIPAESRNRWWHETAITMHQRCAAVDAARDKLEARLAEREDRKRAPEPSWMGLV